MTTAPTHPRPNGSRPLGWLRHSVVLAGRSLAKTTRNPGPIVNGIVTPALFMVVFLYLFGSSVAGSTEKYLQYLLPGILVTGAALAGLVSTGTNITVDLAKGVTDRFRSLPISRVAPLLGSVRADVLRFTVAVLVLFVIGAALGFRVLADSPVAAGLAAAGLAVLLGFGLSWITVLIGVLARDTNAVLAFSFSAFMPLQLGTSLAAPTDTLPGWLRTWAEVNPVTHAMNACRALLNGTSTKRNGHRRSPVVDRADRRPRPARRPRIRSPRMNRSSCGSQPEPRRVSKVPSPKATISTSARSSVQSPAGPQARKTATARLVCVRPSCVVRSTSSGPRRGRPGRGR